MIRVDHSDVVRASGFADGEPRLSWIEGDQPTGNALIRSRSAGPF
jgi:hypothetical protein